MNFTNKLMCSTKTYLTPQGTIVQQGVITRHDCSTGRNLRKPQGTIVQQGVIIRHDCTTGRYHKARLYNRALS